MAQQSAGVGVTRRADVLGVLAVMGAAVVVVVPALVHGASLGPFDILSRYGLTSHPGTPVHNLQATDQIAEMIPWTSLAWTQVHHGHLPLWNPYNGLGLPLAFNWQSAVFGLPTLVGYLMPLHLAFTAQVIVTLLLAGTGVYVFARVLGLSVPACVMAAVVFELSGEFMGVLGWPIAAVMAWAGWLFAAVLFVLRGRRRVRAVALLAVAEALAVYAGQPDILLLLVGGLVVFVVVLLVAGARARGVSGGVLRPLGDLALATVAGAALSAPVLVPGLQLLRASAFAQSSKATSALPPFSLVNLVFQGFNGLSLSSSQWFSLGAAAYVGVIALVLAATGAAMRRRPEVLALVVMGVVVGAVLYLPPVTALVTMLPFRARWHLGLIVVVFAIAVLAGVGTDVVLRAPRDWMTRVWLASGFGVGALVIAAVWVLGRGHLPPAQARVRNESFAWPAASTVLGLVVVRLLGGVRMELRRPRERTGRFGPGHLAVGALLVCETAFLLAVGASVLPSSPTFLPATTGVLALERAVGSSLVGFGASSCELPPTLGILPEANAAYGVRELSAYDPVMSHAYFRTFRPPPGLPVTAFCPVIDSVSEARRYGVGFVLEPAGHPGPPGTVLDRVIGDEVLYRVPGVGEATLVALRPGAGAPSVDAPGTPVPVTHPDAAHWTVVTHAAAPTLLRLRLTDDPGWHATIDGRPLQLQRYGGVMLEARIPAGRHTVRLDYLPGTFTVGVVLALCAAVALAAAGVVGGRRHRHRERVP